MQEGDPRGLFHGPHPTLPTQSFRPASAPSLDIRGEKGQELDIVHSPCHPHVPEVGTVTGPAKAGMRGEGITRLLGTGDP